MTASGLLSAVAGPMAVYLMFVAVLLLGIDMIREIGR